MRIPETETGEFIPGNPAIGKPGSMLTAAYMNSDLREKKSILAAAGMQPSPEDDGQLLKAIRHLLDQAVANRPLIFPIANLPTQDRGPIIVAECAEVWVWTSSAFYTGYRSLLCGKPLDGHTAMPLASEVDAIGGLVPKVGGYAGLWGYAQEQGLVKTEAIWQANRGAHWFSDFSATQFRVPDLRDMFRRFTGTDADTANARMLGTMQRDALQNITGSAVSGRILFTTTTGAFGNVGNTGNTPDAGTTNHGATAGINFDASRVARTSVETRPINVSYHPRIHV
ncbi:MAG: phage tail protein [Achromobacter veterisilvae]